MAKHTNYMEEDYIKFRALISQQKVVVDIDNETWTLYDAGPKHITCPLLCLPPAIGTADAFFKQIIGLSTRGYRIITLSYPVYWTIEEFVKGLVRLIDQLGLVRVHLFGASLGGYLAQKFVEATMLSNRVHSIFLCNSFSDTSVFRQNTLSGIYWTLPAFMLRRTLLQHLPADRLEVRVADATDFMVDRLEALGRSELASRLTLNCSESYVEPQNLKEIAVTIMDVFDECAITQDVKDDMYKCYPQAKRAHLKTGGNFPYLSRSSEVNLYLEIHLRQFVGTPYTALDPARLSACEAELIEELRQLEEMEKQGKSPPQGASYGALDTKSKALDKMTDSNGFQAVQLIGVQDPSPTGQLDNNSPDPLLETSDLNDKDFFKDSDFSPARKMPTPPEVEENPEEPSPEVENEPAPLKDTESRSPIVDMPSTNFPVTNDDL